MHCTPNSFAVTYAAVTLISAYSSLEAFYLTLLPFNVLMADGAEDSSCDHDMAAHKAWVSRCRLVLEGDFLRLAAVKIQEASIREEALLKAARAKGNEAGYKLLMVAYAGPAPRHAICAYQEGHDPLACDLTMSATKCICHGWPAAAFEGNGQAVAHHPLLYRCHAL